MERSSKKKLSKKKLKKLEKQKKAAEDIESIKSLVTDAKSQDGDERRESLRLAALIMLRLPTSSPQPVFDEKTNKELRAIAHQIMLSATLI